MWGREDKAIRAHATDDQAGFELALQIAGQCALGAVAMDERFAQSNAAAAQLQKLDQIVERKRRIYRWYQDRLSEVEQVRFLPVEPGSELVPFRVVLLCEDVRQLMQYAERHAIQARSFFYPLHQQPCFRHLDRRHGGGYDLDDRQYPHAIDGYARGVLLPVFPTLTEQQIEYICTTIRSFYAEKVCVRALSSTNSST